MRNVWKSLDCLDFVWIFDFDDENVNQLEADIVKDDPDAQLFSVGHVFGEEALDFQVRGAIR